MNKKSINIGGLIIAMLFFICPSFAQKDASGKLNFNDGWKFKLLKDTADANAGYAAAGYNDTDWEPVSLPHTAHLEPLVVTNQWQGICWYRKNFALPAAALNKKIFIELEAAMNIASIWINGKLITTNQGGFLPVVFDATAFVITGQENNIAVRLDNRDNPVTGPKPLKILDFNMYGGLYRNAWLIEKDNVHITHPILADKVAGGGVFISFPKVAKDASMVKVQTHIQNEGKNTKTVAVVQAIYSEGKLLKKQQSSFNIISAGKEMEITTEISIDNALLWSPSNPKLYTLRTSVIADGKMLDTETNHFGIRKFEFRNNDLYINGEKTFLRGVNRHQEYPFIGYALSDNAQYRDAKKIKEAGFDYIRLSHYPQSPAFMDACDELGLVVVDAILGWQYYADNDAFRNFCYQSATNLIRRDRNHPCVLAWEVSLNETKMPVFFMKKLDSIVHAEYPGKNVYSCGWMNDVYDIWLQARQHRLLHPPGSISKPYSVSEYGDWEYYSTNAGLNQDKMPKQERVEKSSRQLRSYGEARLLQQASNIQEAHNDNLNTPAFADSYWVMYDYNRGYYDDLESSGIMDIFRLPKFSYYFFKSQQNPAKEIVLNIASYWTPVSPPDVKIFSNCETVKLYLNNELIAEQKPDTGINCNRLQHPPFTFNIKSFVPGILKAIGMIHGKAVAEHTIETPGKAVSFKIGLDESGKPPQAGCNDVVFLHIAAVDNNGTIISDYNKKIRLQLKGDITLMNTGDIVAEAGIATALLRIGNSSGEVIISAGDGNLKPADFKFKID